MRRLCFCLLVLAGLAIVRADDQKVVWNNPTDFTEPGLTHHSFQSEAMGLAVGYSVWLPPGYETSKESYPVIYFLHGSGGTESADAPAFSHLLAAALAAGKIPPVVCVFPNGGLSGYRDQPDSNVKVETMIIRELVPLIDRTYRTRTDRASRVLGGFSMGGGGSLRLSLLYPDLFSVAASWAGALVKRVNGQPVPQVDAELMAHPEKPVRLLMIVGYKDLTYPWHQPVLAMLQVANYPYTLHTLAGVGHDLGKYYELTGDELIQFLTAEFPRAAKP